MYATDQSNGPRSEIGVIYDAISTVLQRIDVRRSRREGSITLSRIVMTIIMFISWGQWYVRPTALKPIHLTGQGVGLIEAQNWYTEKGGTFLSREAGYSWAVDTDTPFQVVGGFCLETLYCGDTRQSYEGCILHLNKGWHESRRNDEASCSTGGESGEVLLYSVVSGYERVAESIRVALEELGGCGSHGGSGRRKG